MDCEVSSTLFDEVARLLLRQGFKRADIERALAATPAEVERAVRFQRLHRKRRHCTVEVVAMMVLYGVDDVREMADRLQVRRCQIRQLARRGEIKLTDFIDPKWTQGGCYEPSPEEIAAKCAAIRSTWSDDERLRRARHLAPTRVQFGDLCYGAITGGRA